MFGSVQFAEVEFAGEEEEESPSPAPIVSVQGWVGRAPRVPYDVFLRELEKLREQEESEEMATVFHLWLQTQN
jgi:hypothetical protein